MKTLLITIAAVVLLGCGESKELTPTPEATPVEPVAKVSTPEPPTAKAPDISIVDAAMRGNIEAVKQHIAAGTDVNIKDDDGFTSLYYAAQNGYKEIAELLIEKGADVNVKLESQTAKEYGMGGATPLRGAVANDHKEMAELLIAKGADVNVKEGLGITLLHFANTREIAELLIAKGLDVNAKDAEGWTPLHSAVANGHAEVAKLFIEKGADVNAKDVDGDTPLDYAIEEGHTETADLLRKHGGKAEELKAEPPTAKAPDISIHDAALYEGLEAVKQHLAAGTDVSAKDEDGVTPLHYAAAKGLNEIVELLIAKGADVNAKVALGPKQGLTALDAAIEKGNNEIADLLRKHGAKTSEELKAEGK